MFLKAEVERLEDDAIAALMGRHSVTRESIMQVCLRNSCETAAPIRYAIRHVKDFDAEQFIEELVEALLCQPYRGPMI